MFAAELQGTESCVINTGNILSLNDIIRKSGQNTTDELIEALNITINHFKNSGSIQQNGKVQIYRPNDDLKTKMEEEPLSNLKIGLKVFLNEDSKVLLSEALDEGFKTLNVNGIHNCVVSYNYNKTDQEEDIEGLKKIWRILEQYVANEKINQIGLADVEEATFRIIYEWASVKPSIIQINLSTCCVVPPTLQSFCKENNVQLLTHSDPADILPKSTIGDSLGISLDIGWILRFLVHIKCRGVLITKGYLVKLGK